MSEITISKGDKRTAQEALRTTIKNLNAAVENGNVKYTVTIESDNDYTTKQRSALHVWCEMMAAELNAAGLYAVEQKALARTFDPSMFEHASCVNKCLELIAKYFKQSYIVKPWNKTLIK